MALQPIMFDVVAEQIVARSMKRAWDEAGAAEPLVELMERNMSENQLGRYQAIPKTDALTLREQFRLIEIAHETKSSEVRGLAIRLLRRAAPVPDICGFAAGIPSTSYPPNGDLVSTDAGNPAAPNNGVYPG